MRKGFFIPLSYKKRSFFHLFSVKLRQINWLGVFNDLCSELADPTAIMR